MKEKLLEQWDALPSFVQIGAGLLIGGVIGMLIGSNL